MKAFDKLKTSALALGLAALPLLTQITVSGGTVELEQTEISSITDSVVAGATSMLNMNIKFIPLAIALTVFGVVFGLLGGFSRLKNWLGKRRRSRR